MGLFLTLITCLRWLFCYFYANIVLIFLLNYEFPVNISQLLYTYNIFNLVSNVANIIMADASRYKANKIPKCFKYPTQDTHT